MTPQRSWRLGRVEAGRRLVEEEHRRAGHQGGGQVEAPAHAARVGLEDAVAGIGQAEPLEQLARPLSGRPAAQVRQAPDHAQVLPAGQVLVDRGVLPGQTDEAAHGVGVRADVVPQDGGRARVGFEDGRQDPHDGRLAGPVGAEQAEHGPRLDLERDAVEGAHRSLTEDLDQVGCLHGERRGAGRGHVPPTLVTPPGESSRTEQDAGGK